MRQSNMTSMENSRPEINHKSIDMGVEDPRLSYYTDLIVANKASNKAEPELASSSLNSSGRP